VVKAIIKFHLLVVEIKNMRDKKNIVIRVNYSKSGKKPENYISDPEMITEWHVKRILLAVSIIVVLLLSVLYFFIKPDVQTTDAPLSDADVDAVAKSEIKDNKYIKEQPIIIKPEDKPKAVNNTFEPEAKKHPGSIKAVEIGKKQSTSIKVEEKGKKQSVIVKHRNVTKKQSAPIVNKNVSRALLTHKINNKEPAGELNLPVKVNKKQAVGVYYFTELTELKGRTLYHEWSNNGKAVFKHPIKVLGNRWRASSSMLFTDNDVGNWGVRLIDESGHILNKKSFKVIIN
jgi:hypothetical protein